MMPKDRPRRIYAVSRPSDFLEPRMGEVRRITLPKLFGKSGWAPNRGSEGAREGSKRPDRPLLAAEEARLRGLGLFSKRFLHALRAGCGVIEPSASLVHESLFGRPAHQDPPSRRQRDAKERGRKDLRGEPLLRKTLRRRPPRR